MPKKLKFTIVRRPGKVIVEWQGNVKFRMTKDQKKRYRRMFQKERSKRMAKNLFGIDRVYRRI